MLSSPVRGQHPACFPNVNGAVLEDLVEALGLPSFVAAALEFANTFGEVDHSAVFATELGGMRCLGAVSADGSRVAAQAAGVYVAGHWKHDPVLLRLLQRPLDPARPLLRVLAAEIRHRAYRRDCYDKADIGEKVVLATVNAGGSVVLNFYRNRGTGPFDDRLLCQLLTHRRILAGLAAKHAQLAMAAAQIWPHRLVLDEISALLRALGAGLTEREMAVLARLVSGLTTEGCALELGIRPCSVATYRRRAYRRLNICSQSELFALLLACRARCHPTGGQIDAAQGGMLCVPV
jgi:DNA-binding CsgD family transcriptional regulator